MRFFYLSNDMSIFNFKEFAVDQQNCPMKINTDGLLLAALCDISNTNTIMDIGTGTGVIALMLAQRNEKANIEGVDIDFNAYQKASLNFKNSKFNKRLTAHHQGFYEYFSQHPEKTYDLIISNPPFFLNALKPQNHHQNISKHTEIQFFEDLFRVATDHLTDRGTIQLIVPIETSKILHKLSISRNLFINHIIEIKSFPHSPIIRNILCFSRNQKNMRTEGFCIYAKQGLHTDEYREALNNFLTIF